MDLDAALGGRPAVVGMVHLPALPGAPGYDGSRDAVREAALHDARALDAGGVDAVLVENYGDAPFYPDEVPRHVVADLTAVVAAVRREVSVPVGVNVLRNDATAAVSVAAAADASFVRVNVHTGARLTDQGVVEGRAHETMRLRDRVDADVAVLADVAVKHSAALADVPFEQAVADTIERGLADGVVVSGAGTGESIPRDRLDAAAAVLDDRDAWLFAGSGVTPETAGDLLATADGAIVGTALKVDGVTTNPVDEDRVAALVAATR
jgi:membrane complex biogenesis BtpA family protein